VWGLPETLRKILNHLQFIHDDYQWVMYPENFNTYGFIYKLSNQLFIHFGMLGGSGVLCFSRAWLKHLRFPSRATASSFVCNCRALGLLYPVVRIKRSSIRRKISTVSLLFAVYSADKLFVEIQ